MVSKHIMHLCLRFRVFSLVFLFGLSTFSYSEESIELLLGRFQQGNLIVAKTSPLNTVHINDRLVSVDKQGRFTFGIGRDDTDDVVITIKQPSMELIKRSFPIESRSYNTQKITGVDQKYVSPAKEVLERIQQDNRQVKQARSKSAALPIFFDSGFIWPADGPITGVYGSQRVFNGVPKRPHFGLDIAGPVGTKVIAPASGTVMLAHDDMYYSGGTLIIDHGFGISSTFIHLSDIHVNIGQKVQQGELIADIGATGRVTGPHLDWRINWYNQRLDPQLLLPSR